MLKDAYAHAMSRLNACLTPRVLRPYHITRCMPSNAYFYETLEGEEFNRALNGKHFKKYYPSIWVDA